MKILNPVGYKLSPVGPLQRCAVVRKGLPFNVGATMGPDNVWWLMHPTTRAVIPAMLEARTGQFKE